MGRTVTLEEVEARTVGDLLRELARECEALHVVFEGGGGDGYRPFGGRESY